ncbi:hypothetical protein [Nocardia sp. NRRL S-836]|nr:hypothetical protein [Nocardia sp. NRRL S-836]
MCTTRTPPLPDASARSAALWETSTNDLSGKAARNAFRNAYEQARVT